MELVPLTAKGLLFPIPPPGVALAVAILEDSVVEVELGCRGSARRRDRGYRRNAWVLGGYPELACQGAPSETLDSGEGHCSGEARRSGC